MKLKRPAQEVSYEIQARAQSAAKQAMSQMNPYGTSPMSPMVDMVTQAIAMAVAEGFRVMMEAQYTDEDFERDLGLKG